MYNKILIPLDGTLRAEQALQLVNRFFVDAELILLETTGNTTQAFPIYGAGVHGYIEPLPEVKKARNDEYVASVADRTRNWATNVRGYSLIGPPDIKIVEVAEAEEVDLIVMVTHGYDRFERLLFGSVTQKVIRDAPCPVLAVRDGELPEHMLIALDGTPFSEEILEPAFKLAKLLRLDVTLARVDMPKDDISYADVASIREIDSELAELVLSTHNSRAEFYLDDIRKRYLDSVAGIDIKIDYDVDYGDPAARLPAIAKFHDCDLIAMATHGRKGIEYWLKGSVTEKVMHKTDVAMLILHHEVEEEPAG